MQKFLADGNNKLGLSLNLTRAREEAMTEVKQIQCRTKSTSFVALGPLEEHTEPYLVTTRLMKSISLEIS